MYFLDEGKLALLSHMIHNDTLDCKMHGYKNNVDIYEADQFGATTEVPLEECDFGGYTPLNMDSFTDPDLTLENLGRTQGMGIGWTADNPVEPQTCFGIYVTMLDSFGERKKVFAQRFLEPQEINEDGDVVEFGLSIFDDDVPYDPPPP